VERFDAANLCPQCEGRAASYKLHAYACPEVGADRVHMHRQCPSCGYEWAESQRTPPSNVVDLAQLERDAGTDTRATEPQRDERGSIVS
jgi:hypothetical protein